MVLRRLPALLAALCVAAPVLAQSPKPPRLDVPYVPTNQATVEAMLRVANVGPGDYVVDLGSGDRRVAFTLVDDADFTHRVLFEGTVGTNTMEGVARGDGSAPGGERKWRAHRAVE